MVFWCLTILAIISGVYCCDFPIMVDIPFLINDHSSILYGIGQSIIAAYIFYIIQIVIPDKVRLHRCRDAAYFEINEIEKRMNSIISLLSGKANLEKLEDYSDENIVDYLKNADIFRNGSKIDIGMKEMTIMEALIYNLEIIDERIRNLLFYNLIDESKKNFFRDVSHASLKKIIKEMKENEPGSIENVKVAGGEKVMTTGAYRVFNYEVYVSDIVLALKTYNTLLSVVKRIEEQMYAIFK